MSKKDKKRRSVSDVVSLFTRAMSLLEPAGLAIEPIATQSDPQNEVDGDYSVRVTFMIGGDEEHCYCSVFAGAITMSRWLNMPDKKFHETMYEIVNKASHYKAFSIMACQDGSLEKVAVIGPKGHDPDLGRILKEAMDLMSATKH